MKEFMISLPVKKYRAETVRYAAYTLCGRAHVLLEKRGGKFKAVVRPRDPASSAAELKKMFFKALKEEKFSEALFRENQGLYSWMLKSAVNYREGNAYEGRSPFTPEETEELDALISRVEAEMQAVGKEGLSEIGKKWEEKYGGKTGQSRKK